MAQPSYSEFETPGQTGAASVARKDYVDAAVAKLATQQFTAGFSQANSNADNTMWTLATYAASDLQANVTLFMFRIGGTFDNAATSGTFTFKIKCNGVVIATLQVPSQSSAATGTTWWMDVAVYVDVIGATGGLTAHGMTYTATGAGGGVNPRMLSTTTPLLNLTSGLTFTVTEQMSTASASNIVRMQRGHMQRLA